MRFLQGFILTIISLFLTLSIPGCSQEKYFSLSDYSSVRKADVHIHIRTERDAFVKQAIEDNFKLVNIVVDGAGKWQNVRDQFRYAVSQQEQYPDQLRTISAFSVEGFSSPDWAERAISWMDSTFDQGAIGIKVWKNIGMVLKDSTGSNIMLDDPRFDMVFDFLVDGDKLVIGHLGEPLNCWLPLDEMTTNNDRNYFSDHPQYHMYLHPELPSYEDQMSARDRRMDQHPELNFVGAHMASLEWNVDTLAAWLDKYPTATIDLAARMGQVFFQAKEDNERVRNFFIKYSKRIMYATDLGDNGTSDPQSMANRMHQVWMRDWEFFATDNKMESDLVEGSFQGIKLPRETVEDIFYGTAVRVFDFDQLGSN